MQELLELQHNLGFETMQNYSIVKGIKIIWHFATINAPANIPDRKKAHILAPTTGLCSRLLGFAPDYWALHPTTELCPRLLGFALDY